MGKIYDPQPVIDKCKRDILRAALNMARLESMGFYIDDNGNSVHTRDSIYKESQALKIRNASKEWLQLLTESSEDNPPPE